MKKTSVIPAFSKILALMALVSFSLLLVAPASFAVNTPGTLSTPVPTLLPTDDTQVGGDSRFCAGLADKIRTGEIHLETLPCFVKFFSETVIALAGTIAVLFVIYGGFRYVTAGISESQAEAKKTIQYALLGLAITLLSWVIVDVVLQIATE